MKRLLPALLLLAACEAKPMPDPCAEGFSRLQQGDMAGAMAALQKALPVDFAHKAAVENGLAAACASKAASHLKKGEKDQATEALRVAQSAGPGVLRIARVLYVNDSIGAVHAALEGGDAARAVDLFGRLKLDAPQESAPHAAAVAAKAGTVAWKFAAENNLEKAAATFQEAAGLSEDGTPAKDDLAALAAVHRAKLHLQVGKAVDARNTLAQALQRRMSESTAALARVSLRAILDAQVDEALGQKNFQVAVSMLKEAPTLDPDNAVWWISRQLHALVAQSDELAAKDNLQAALLPLQDAANLPRISAKPVVEPKIRALMFKLATAAMREKDWNTAIADFDTVAGLDDRDPLVFELRIQCYEARGLWRQAGGDYDRLAELIPSRSAEFKKKAEEARKKFKPADGDAPRDQ
jgi:tetratricopeptide (TPR) repeat protein